MSTIERQFLIIGLDCLGAEILMPESLADMPNLRQLVAEGLSGPLQSTLPPITVPAWTAMLTGRDPGELGLYGFRNRRSYGYGDLVYASSTAVRYPRIWDYVSAAGGNSVVIGVPQTWPPPTIRGDLVAGFDTDSDCVDIGLPFTSPPNLADEVAHVVGKYSFDVQCFRDAPREAILMQVYAMTERRFRLMTHLLERRSWDFAILCEIAPDRLHHYFWSDHDPAHPRHDRSSLYSEAIRQYYGFVDGQIGQLLTRVSSDAMVMVASDHGALPMHGGIYINEFLRRFGWLALNDHPTAPTLLKSELVDWSRTRAWGEGGYYARIFLNIQGREPHGVIPPEARDDARRDLTTMLKSLELPEGPILNNEVVWPEKTYRRVRGLAPDLLVFFGGLHWRSLGTVGCARTWLTGTDSGIDEANHARDGLYILSGPGVPSGVRRRASILDVTPTALQWMGLKMPADLSGHDLLDENGVES